MQVTDEEIRELFRKITTAEVIEDRIHRINGSYSMMVPVKSVLENIRSIENFDR